MTKQDLPQPGRRKPGAVSGGKPADRASSIGVAERMFDLTMMILFGLLGLILIALAIPLHSAIAVVGGVIVVLSVVPLWLGGRRRGGGVGRTLGWYPVAAVVLAVGLLVWIHPWS